MLIYLKAMYLIYWVNWYQTLRMMINFQVVTYQGYVAKGAPIDQFLEYGIYKILEDKQKITQEHYSRITTLCE